MADWLLIGVLVTLSVAAIIAAIRKLVGGNTTVTNSPSVNVTVSAPPPLPFSPELFKDLAPGSTVKLTHTVTAEVYVGDRPISISSNTVINTDRGLALLLEAPPRSAAFPPDDHS